MQKSSLIIIMFCVLGTKLSAQTVFMEDVIINGDGSNDQLCVGDDCSDTEVFVSDDVKIKLKDESTAIEFDDTNHTSWRLEANQGGFERFQLIDQGNNTAPVEISANAPSNSLFISGTGETGLGTIFPQADLHIVSGPRDGRPSIRLDTGAVTDYSWAVNSSFEGFEIEDITSFSTPFKIAGGTPTDSLKIDGNGNIGMGVRFPLGKLHTWGAGVQLVYFESANGGPVQVRFRTNSENRRFLAVNNNDEVKSQIIFLDDRINFTGQTDSGANLWLSIGPDGIVSQGPTCNPGLCDATFDPDVFEVPPLKERTAYMWENQHLWAVGPTKPGEPINLTEKTGAMLHELEVAYIYIEQLHDEIAELKRQKVEAAARQEVFNAQMLSRLEALEAE